MRLLKTVKGVLDTLFYRLVTFVIASQKCCRKPFQTLIDINFGNISMGVYISVELCVSMQI